MMRRIGERIILFVFSSCLISTSAFAYYQDKYNPNSRTFQPQNSNYYKNVKSYSTHSWQDNTRSQKKSYAQKQRRDYNFPSQRTATGRKVFIYDPRQHSWAAYDHGGSLVRTGAGSSGKSYCPDLRRGCRTPSGTFRVFAKKGPSFKSSRFPLPNGGAPMMYAMFFYKGFAIHGSNDVPRYNASHGCVRVLPSDAQWLNHNFLSYGSTVIIKSY